MTLDEFAPIGALLLLSLILGVVALNLSLLFGPRKANPRKTAPYESGMIPIGPAVRRLPIKFWLVAVLFILFDVEVVFFFPWVLIFRDLGLYGLGVMGVFFIILTVGLLYEWKKGALEWD